MRRAWVWALRHQTGAPCSAVECTKAGVAVRWVVAPAPQPESASHPETRFSEVRNANFEGELVCSWMYFFTVERRFMKTCKCHHSKEYYTLKLFYLALLILHFTLRALLLLLHAAVTCDAIVSALWRLNVYGTINARFLLDAAWLKVSVFLVFSVVRSLCSDFDTKILQNQAVLWFLRILEKGWCKRHYVTSILWTGCQLQKKFGPYVLAEKVSSMSCVSRVTWLMVELSFRKPAYSCGTMGLMNGSTRDSRDFELAQAGSEETA